jgi:hypothetical protein
MVRKVGGTRKKAKRVSGVKHRKTTHCRKRRISGVGDMGGMLEKAAGLVGGACLARELNTLAANFVELSPMVSGVMQIGAGLMLPKLIPGKWGEFLGDGMIANGGMVVVVSTGIISGAGNGHMAYQVNGTSNLPVVNGTSNLPVVNGNRIQNTQRMIAGNRIQNTVAPLKQLVKSSSPQQHYV